MVALQKIYHIEKNFWCQDKGKNEYSTRVFYIFYPIFQSGL